VEAGFKVDGVNIVAADRRVVGHVRMESVPSPYNYALMLPQSAINQCDSLDAAQAWRNSNQFKSARKIGDQYARSAPRDRGPPPITLGSSSRLLQGPDLDDAMRDRARGQ
jgi:hypothetical protein